ncbi:MAG: HEAT repeat domain-containing protein [Myxococcota bacterium]|nr:HEAT repeat domain-containing protein [Myxococcota bacterium]
MIGEAVISVPDFETRALSPLELESAREQLHGPALLLALSDERAQVRANAALALGVVGHFSPELFKALADLDESVRRAARDALENLGAVSYLAAAELCIQLHEIRARDRLPMLDFLLELPDRDPKTYVESMRVENDQALGHMLLVDQMGMLAQHHLKVALRDGSTLIRRNAVAGFRRLYDDGQAVDVLNLRTWASDPEDFVRQGTRQILDKDLEYRESFTSIRPLPIALFDLELLDLSTIRFYKSNLRADFMVALLTDRRMVVRSNAVRSLGVLAHPHPKIGVMLKDPDLAPRESAARALMSLGTTAGQALRYAASCQENQEPYVAAMISRALFNVAGEADELLIDCLNCNTDYAQAHITPVFLLLGPKAEPILMRALQHARPRVRLHALQTVARLTEHGFAFDLEQLEPLLEDGVAAIRLLAKQLIANAQDAHAEDYPHPDFGARLLELDELSTLADELDDTRLQELLCAKFAYARANAARALDLKGIAVPALLDRLLDSVDLVRDAAATALRSLSARGLAGELLVQTLDKVIGASATTRQHLLDGVAELCGEQDELLISALLVTGSVLEEAVLPVFDQLGERAVPLLERAILSESVLTKRNGLKAMQRLARQGIDFDRSLLLPISFETLDEVRVIAKSVLQIMNTRLRYKRLPDARPMPVEGFDARVLELEELAEQADKLEADRIRELLSDGRILVRSNAIRAAQVIRSAYTELGYLLRDSEPQVAEQAADALLALTPDSDVWLLRSLDALPSLAPTVRTKVLSGLRELARREPRLAIEMLRRPLHEADETSFIVFDGLGADGLDILGQALRSDSMLVRLNAIHEIGRLFEAGIDIEAQEEAIAFAKGDAIRMVGELAEELELQLERKRKVIQLLEARPLPAPAFAERVLEAEELGSLEGANTEHLVEQLQDGRRFVRCNAALLLAQMGVSSPRLELSIQDTDAEVRACGVRAMITLAEHGQAHLLQRSIPLFSKLEEETRRSLEQALASLAGHDDAVLIESLRYPSHITVAALGPVCDSLGALALPILYKALRNESGMVRSNAALLLLRLARQGIRIDEEVAQIASGDVLEEVRSAAQAILDKVGELKRIKPVLLDAEPLPSPGFAYELLSVDALEALREKLEVLPLLKLLADGRIHVRANAARALAVLGHADSRLLLLLRDTDENVRQAAAHALAMLGPNAAELLGAAIPALVGASGDVRRHLFSALCSLVEQADAVLVEALRLPTPVVEETMMPVFDQLGERALPVLAKATHSDSTLIRINAVHCLDRLVRQGVGVALSLVEPLVSDRLEEVRRVATTVMQAINVRKRRRELAEAKPLPMPDFDSVEFSIEELSAKQDKLDAERLVECLDDGRALVRANAARALGVMGQVQARLVQLLRDAEPRVAIAAAESLRLLGAQAGFYLVKAAQSLLGLPPEVRQKLLLVFDSLPESNPQILIESLRMPAGLADDTVIQVFVHLGQSSVEALQQGLRSESVLIRINAARALAALISKGHRVELVALELAAGDPVEEVRRAARAALFEVRAKDKARPQPIEEVPIEGFYREILELKALKPAKKVPKQRLLLALQDGRSLVRANAARGLGWHDDLSALDVQHICVQLRDVDPEVRVASAWAIGRFAREASIAIPRMLEALVRAQDEFRETLLRSIEAFGDEAKPLVLSYLDRPTHELLASAGRIVERHPEDYLEALIEVLRSRKRSERAKANASLLLATTLPDSERARNAIEQLREAARPQRSNAPVTPPPKPPRAADPTPLPLPDFDAEVLSDELLRSRVDALDVERLIQVLNDGRDLVRLNAARALRWMGERAFSAVPALVVRVKDQSPRVAVAAAQAVAELQHMPHHCVGELALATRSPSPPVREAALAAVDQFGEQGADILIREFDKKPMRWFDALRLIVVRSPARWVPRLRSLIDNTHLLKVREKAVELLSDLGDLAEPARPELLEALKHPEGALRVNAIWALSHLPKDDATITHLEQLQLKDTARSTQYACRCALAALRGDEGLPPEPEVEIRGRGVMEDF